MAMASNVDARLARLEGLIHAQGNTIAEQARTIADQASTIARLSSDTQAHAAVDRHHDRQLVKLSRAVFREGEWVEQGTIDRRARSEQSWKLGGEGDKKWEWQTHKASNTNYFDRLPEELLVMIFELCEPSHYTTLCKVSLGFLARVTLFLYREITLDGTKATQLFCSRTAEQNSRHNRISQHLSFGNTRKITLDTGVSRHISASLPPLIVYNDRFACKHSNNLKLDSVALRTQFPTTDLGYWNPVLSLLDPYHVKLYGSQHDQFRYPRTTPLPSIGCPFLHTWTRLESVTSMGEIVFVHPNDTIALVPTLPTRRPRHIEYQIHQAPPKGEGGKTIEILDDRNVLAIMRERWRGEMGLWTYLRVTLVDDAVEENEKRSARKAGKDKRASGPAAAAGKRKGGKKKRGSGPGTRSGTSRAGEIQVSMASM